MALDLAGSDGSPDQLSLPATPDVASSQGEGEQAANARPGDATSTLTPPAGHPRLAGRYWLTDKGDAALDGRRDPTLPHVITVLDTPAPQGSKKGFIAGGRAVVVDDNKPWLRTWREAVKQAALDQHRCDEPHSDNPYLHRCPLPLMMPIGIEITFTLPKPVSAPKRRVTWPKGRPDVDKLVRSTFDALTAAGMWKDDAQVVELVARKVYPEEGIDALRQPGALIRIWTVST